VRTEGDAYIVTIMVLGVAVSPTWVYEDGRWRQHAAEDTGGLLADGTGEVADHDASGGLM
jgi:hypothetical protein